MTDRKRVQESGSFQTTQKVPKKSDFLGKIGFFKPCPRCPRNPIFWKNRISQTIPKAPKKSEIRFFWKNRISQTVPKAAKKSDFLGKIGFLKPCLRCPRNPIFWEKSVFSNRAQGAQEIRFFGLDSDFF
jgi:hypothetical protein